jgi:NAD-dependent dihydropyrimidine dehydrogenase PreA subunit
VTYVIKEPCIGVKDASCTEVCPVDCIHPTADEPGSRKRSSFTSTPRGASTVC